MNVSSSRPRRRFHFFRIDRGGEIHAEAQGFSLQAHSVPAPDGGVHRIVFASDYPLPDLAPLASRFARHGISALAELPDNTVCVASRPAVGGAPAVIVARDKVGNTPIYAFSSREEDGQIWVASAAALFRERVPLFRPTLSPGATGEYLLFRYTSGPHTLMAEVETPLAGYALQFDGSAKSRHVCYWDVRETFTALAAGSARRADRGDVRETGARIATSVDEALGRERAFPRLGLMFSAGFDSCYIAYLAHRSRLPLTLYTLSFPGAGRSDLEAATVESRHLGMPIRTMEIDRAAYAETLPDAVESFGWPIDHPNFVARERLFRRVVDDGVERLISGDGSDTLFGGAWYVSLAKALALRDLVPSPSRLAPLIPARPGRLQQVRKILGSSVEELVVFDKTYYPQPMARALAGPSQASLAHLRGALDDVAGWPPLDQAFYLAFLTTLSVFPAAHRAMALASGADVAYPYLTEGVVRAANALTGVDRMGRFHAKRLLHVAARGVVPQRIYDRQKFGLPIPMEDFILGAGGLCRYLDLVRDPVGVCAGALDRGELRTLTDAVAAGQPSRDQLELYWVLVNLEVWGRQALRGEAIG